MSMNKQDLIKFENNIKSIYEAGKIKGPIHLSRGNEDYLISIFKKINNKNDWVFSSWRNHYHALLKGIPENILKKRILEGRSMGVCFEKYKFYSSSIVAGSLSIALGTSLSIKKKNSKSKVWCFIGDMTAETGVFHECYKYAMNFNLPINFIIEDNNLSTNTPTNKAWKKKSNFKNKSKIIYYKYKRELPHHGTGSWVLF